MSVRFDRTPRHRDEDRPPRGVSASPEPDPPCSPVLGAIERHAAGTPGSPALDDGHVACSYGELWARSGKLAAHLAGAGAGTGTCVAVTGPRTTAFAIAMLSVLRAGGVAVPVAASLPVGRASATATAAGARLVVAAGDPPSWAEGRPTIAVGRTGRVTGPRPIAPLAPCGPAATVYCTSGTTGSVRAVRGSHLVLHELATWQQVAFGIERRDRIAVATSLSAVASARSLFGALYAGATAVLAPEDLLPEDGLDWVRRCGVSVLHLTPSRARSWLDHAPPATACPALRWTLLGGEPLTSSLVHDWRAAVRGTGQVASIWGTTEVGGARSWYVVPDRPRPGRQPLGQALPNTRLLVVDEAGRPCGPGEQGEIVVRSASIADGYCNDPAASTARFTTADLHDGTEAAAAGALPGAERQRELLYRTGDLGRYEPDGTLVLDGRVDDQLSIGGARVEPAEVASHLAQHPAVRAAHVQAVAGAGGVPALVAFVTIDGRAVPQPAAPMTADPSAAWSRELRRWCGTTLPAFAVPSRFVVLDELPTTPLGKIDRAALHALAVGGDLLPAPLPPAPAAAAAAAAAPAAEGTGAADDPRPDPTIALAEPEGCLLDDIATVVAERPDAPAVDDGRRRLTYDELWTRAGVVARELRSSGAHPGTRVMVSTPRDASFAVAMTGVLRAGAVAVPCASMLPDARCETMAGAVGATHVVWAGPHRPSWAPHLAAVEVSDRDAADTPSDAAGDVVPLPVPGEHAVIFFTSGTTGVPKAVLGRHPSIAHYLRWWRSAFDIGPGDRIAMATSTAFDVTLRNLFGPLTAGATVCIAPDDLLPEDGLGWLTSQAVTVLHVTPSLASAWLTEAPAQAREAPRSLRWTLFAGEMLTDVLVRDWRSANPGTVANMYGPTETTMSRCLYVVPDEPVTGPQPVGHPLPGTQVLVVDDQGRLCAVGEAGEVLVRTRSGTAGYCNNPDEQSRRFVPNPFTGDPVDLVYRTGDIGEYRADGSLLLRGRVDDQVKIGGVRVEPAEVTAVIVEHPDVRAACVVAHPDRNGTPSLVAFVVTTTCDDRALRAALRRHCGERLTPAAVPGHVVVVQRLPMTSNGKVDRARLLALLDAPAPDDDHGRRGTTGRDGGVDARNAAREPDRPHAERDDRSFGLDELVAVWRDVLRRDDIEADTNFFDAGGTSVAAIRLANRLRDATGHTITFVDLYDAQTPRELAGMIGAQVVGGRHDEAERRPAGFDRPVRLWLRRAPMSFAQRRVWLLDQLGLADTSYLVTAYYDVVGPLDPERLRRAMYATARRHEVLRTRFVASMHTDDLAEQVIDPEPDIELVRLDLRGDRADGTAVETLVRHESERPFDLAGGHPWRAVLARTGDAQWVLGLTVHHIATDAESQRTLVQDLADAYAADSPIPTALPAIQYADHAVWQHARHASGALEAALDHWERELSPPSDPLELPASRPRPPQVSSRGSQVTVRADVSLIGRVDELARSLGTTPFVVMLAAYQLLLHRITERADITVGIPVTERRHQAEEATVGFFVNTVPVRAAFTSAGSGNDVIRATSSAVARAVEHAHAPLDLIIERLALPRDPSTSPVVQTMFTLQERTDAPRFPGLRSVRRSVAHNGSAKFDLSLLCRRNDRDLTFVLEYRTDLFEQAEVQAWAEQYALLLDGLTREPGRAGAELALVDDTTLRWLLDDCNATAVPYPRDATVVDLFDEVLETHADAVAIVDGSRRCTYAALSQASDMLTARLRGAGVVTGDRVALSIGRSTELVVAMLATLRCGAAYTPIDPSYPAARRMSMLTATDAAAVVSCVDGEWVVEPTEPRAAGPRDDPAAGDLTAASPAYVMFTSGSTGTPKGVVIPHRGIVRLVRNADYVQFGDRLVIGHLSNTSFDAATFEIWGALCNGAQLVVLDTDTVTSPGAFAEAIRTHGITTLFVTAALFHVITRERPDAFATLEHLLVGGEVIDPAAVRAVLAAGPPALLANVYGPTESTTFASWHPIDRLGPEVTNVPIGRPIANTTLHVTDRSGRLVPPLTPGELLIGGDGLALGYFRDPDLTAERFVPDPFTDEPGARLYRTGDIVRRRHDGAIEFIGRRDHQVKVRGFRIELGEIEAALRALPGVHNAFVTTHRSEQGDTRVLAYVVPTSGTSAGDLDEAALRRSLRAVLPGYMIPDAVVALDRLPLNSNGKVDRAALPRPDESREPGTAPRATADDPLGRHVHAIWRRVLGRDEIGIDDNFFDIGGTSVQAVRLFAAVERELHVRLALSMLFDAPTVRSLAALLHQQGATVRTGANATSGPTTASATGSAPGATDPYFVTLNAGDPRGRLPLYLVHPAGGQLFVYASLLQDLGNQPVTGIKEHGWGDPGARLPSLEAYASRYAEALEAREPVGPLLLGGYSLGGLIAYEMACILRGRGRQIELVLLLDAAPAASAEETSTPAEPAMSKVRRRFERDGAAGIAQGGARVARRRLRRRVVEPVRGARDLAYVRLARRFGVPVDPLAIGRQSERDGRKLRGQYRPKPYSGRVVYFRAVGTDADFPIASRAHRWRPLVATLETIDVPGNHAHEDSMLNPPNASTLAAAMARVLDDVSRRS